MRIRRLSLTLPSTFAKTAGHDARTIAEAIGREIAKGGTVTGPIRVTGRDQTGAQIAQSVTAQMPRKGGTRHGR